MRQMRSKLKAKKKRQENVEGIGEKENPLDEVQG